GRVAAALTAAWSAGSREKVRIASGFSVFRRPLFPLLNDPVFPDFLREGIAVHPHDFGCTTQIAVTFLKSPQDEQLLKLRNRFGPINSFGHHLINNIFECLLDFNPYCSHPLYCIGQNDPA
ncbi:hypothetical protein MYX82_10705, partial [Acidobacteria bacterium AH-259-D05]|nr:hypothetical protein [Acidobacteria bacterium AH-259-D05]